MGKDKPGPACTICKHKKKDEINDRLLARPQSCESIRSISNDFGLSESALKRHNEKCIPDKLSKAKDIADTIGGESLKCRLKAHRDKIEDCFKMALGADNLRDCHNFIVDGLAEMKFSAELDGKIAAQAQVNVQVNILQSPEWIAHENRIIKALEAFPPAREAIVNALRG